MRDLDGLKRGRAAMAARILAKIQSLSDEPAAGKPLVGPIAGIRSLWVGGNRILYEVRKTKITVLMLARRSRFAA